MEEVQVFNNEEFGEVRSIAIDGEPWFVGKDVATALGYRNSSKAVINHVMKMIKLQKHQRIPKMGIRLENLLLLMNQVFTV